MSEPVEPTNEILKTAIDEQRRVYDWLSESSNQLRTKIITFLGGGLAALTFLYANVGSAGQLFIPAETYGRIFYFAGVGLSLIGISCLMMALRPVYWEFPTEKRDLQMLDYDKAKDYYKYVKERYMIAYDINVRTYEYKQKLFNTGFSPLIFGVMILVVLKLF